ncbi:MAG: M23 family metallopeptidase [Verrucomicrobiales bacterium]|nr:M23 family metallopeptidase [Verrucomicrobiales bacterium]
MRGSHVAIVAMLAFSLAFLVFSRGCLRQPAATTPQAAAAQTAPPSSAPANPTPALRPPPLSAPPPVRQRPPAAAPGGLRFQLPTANDGILAGRENRYYMFVDRTVNGQSVEVWQGGMYGFVRDPKTAPDGTVVFSRFHEGMDVAPVRRDSKGEPLDTVHAMADGLVVMTNVSAGKSNYGNYVIVRHATESGPFFSLYAHLARVDAVPGQQVACGGALGIMGHTGTGINRRRSHVHVELNLLISARHAQWNEATVTPSTAPNPTMNGLNLVGLDVAGWLLAVGRQPTLRLSDFIRESEPGYRVRLPNRGSELEMVLRYPWLRLPGEAAASWEVTFAGSGVPLSVAPESERTETPRLTWVKPFAGNHLWNTREMLSGTGSSAQLTAHGTAYLKLITGE